MQTPTELDLNAIEARVNYLGYDKIDDTFTRFEKLDTHLEVLADDCLSLIAALRAERAERERLIKQLNGEC